MTPADAAQGAPRLLRKQIAEAVEAAIITGEYPPGARLIERELVERFGGSSIPVREALQDLEGRGLVVKLPNVGCRVVELTPEDLRAVIEVRRLLEPAVMGWAAERIDKEDHEALKAMWKRLDEAARADDLWAYFHIDLDFHRMIWRIAGNRFAEKALEMVAGPMFASGMVRGLKRGTLRLREESQKHKLMLQAILKGDSAVASRTLEEIAIDFEDQLVGEGEPNKTPRKKKAAR